MATPTVEVGIALGSNLGDRRAELESARKFLGKLIQKMEISSFIETAPVDCPPGSAPFLNAMVVGKVDPRKMPALKLLEKLVAYEQERGRPVQRAINTPRKMDLDLIYYGDRVIVEANLFVPHPRAWQRRFVLQPLSELRPYLVLPGQSKTVQELLEMIP